MTDHDFMYEALKQAKKAFLINEVPIGCVIVYENKIIARGYNRRITEKSTLSHAEIIAIRKACKKLGDWRLEGCCMYVTLEPCPMCAGAVVQARIPKIFIGAPNPKAGCAGSIIDLFHVDKFNHQVDVTYMTGNIHDECSRLMKDFFKQLRKPR